jgi:DNA-binding NtrC family response regulator
MNVNTPHNVPQELSGSHCRPELAIALISPNESRRAAAAESACDICEFSSYLANPVDQARMSQMQYDVILVDIDGDLESSLKLVEKLSSDGKAWVLVYSSDRTAEKLSRCMRAGARDFLAFPFEAAAVSEALKRSSLPRATCVNREPSAPRKVPTNADSMWQYIFNQAPMGRSQARP